MKYAALVSCTDNYKQYLTAQLNSLDYWGHQGIDYHIIAIDMDKKYLDKIRATDWHFDVFIHERSLSDYPEYKEGGKNIQAKKARYGFLSKLLENLNYGAAIFLDADIFFVDNIMPYFQMVEGTPFVMGVNENFKWNLAAYEFDGKSLPDRRMYWMLCNSPLFFDLQQSKLFIEFALWSTTKVWEKNKKRTPSDLFCMNVALFLSGKVQRNEIINLPNYLWTGVHYSYFGLQTRIRRQRNQHGDIWVSRMNERVHSIHGRWDREQSKIGVLNNVAKKLHETDVSEKFKDKYLQECDNLVEQIKNEFKFYTAEWKLRL
jgi:hypothetical protein